MPTPVTLTTEGDDGWWLWWEYNKMEFLRPNRLGLWGFPATGDGGEAELKASSGVARARLEPMLLEAVGDPDPAIRAAAAIAFSRIAGGESVDPLLRLLGDPSEEVRERAILALGATGSDKAVQPLLALAREGTPVENSKDKVSPYARPLAVVALALGRRAGFNADLDAGVAKIVRAQTGTDREPVVAAALIYQSLVPCPEFAKLALDIVDDTTLSPAVRCRAVESLSHSSDSGVPGRLVRLLTGPRLDLRRSAALALGSVKDSESMPALQAAFTTEPEPLTRGFILVSIGRQGGAKAHDLLLKVAKDGEPTMRPWAALALGILARPGGDPDAARVIRDAGAHDKAHDNAAAYWIAGGLAHDDLALPYIRDGLLHAADPRQRMYASTALALLGGDAAEEALRSRLDTDDSALVRTSIAAALGYLGRREDAAALASTIQKLREPGLQGLTATALSFHGSIEAFLALSEYSRSTSGPSVRRAAAIEGLGMMLGDHEPLLFAEVSRQANYTVFPEWVKGLFQVTL
jgi:HEAT repeat protein